MAAPAAPPPSHLPHPTPPAITPSPHPDPSATAVVPGGPATAVPLTPQWSRASGGSGRSRRRWGDGVRRFWRGHIALAAPVRSRRDHLALERTFLGYIRTSIVLTMAGTLVAQLFRLGNKPDREGRLGFYELALPLACLFISAAIAVTILGAIRFYRQQHAIARGKVHAGGFEIYTIMVLVFAIMVAVFGLVLAVQSPVRGDNAFS